MADRMTWSAFWPFYLGEHADERNRLLHFMGTTVAALLLLATIATRVWWVLVAALVVGYAFAWAGHFLFEKNRPATFQYPIKSFAYDWKMWALTLTGRLGAEMERLGIESTDGTTEASAGAASHE